MKTDLQLGALLLHIGLQMRDLTWIYKDPSYKAVSIFITVIMNIFMFYLYSTFYYLNKYFVKNQYLSKI